MSISNYPSGFRGGALIKGVPMFDAIDGNVFWVDSGSGGAGNPGTFNSPLDTIAGAIAKCTASNNDVIYVKAGHAETLTASIAVNIAGVSIIGLGRGNLRPTLTGNGTIDVLAVSAANVTIANLVFAVPSTDAQTADIDVAAAGCRIYDTMHHGSTTSKNKVSFITVTSAGADLLIDGMRAYNDTVDVVSAIELGAAARVEIANSIITSIGSIGYSTAVIDDTAACTDLYIHNCIFKNAKAATAVLDFTSNSSGICADVRVSGRHTTIASNIIEGTSMDFFETYVTEEAALNGVLHPVADAD